MSKIDSSYTTLTATFIIKQTLRFLQNKYAKNSTNAAVQRCCFVYSNAAVRYGIPVQNQRYVRLVLLLYQRGAHLSLSLRLCACY